MAELTQRDLIENFNSQKVSIHLNHALNGVEIKFNDMALARQNNALIKAAGFRWSGRQQLWYCRQNEQSINFALSLRGEVIESMRKNGEKTYTASEVNAAIEKELENSFAPKNEGLKFEIIETQEAEQTELEELLRQQAEITRKIERIRAVQEEFNPMNFLESFTNLLDNNSFVADNVNSVNKTQIQYSESQEADYESKQSGFSETGKSQEPENQRRENIGYPGTENNLGEFNQRTDSPVGRDSGYGDGGTGYGDSIQNSEELLRQRGQNSIQNASADNSVSDGFLRQGNQIQDSSEHTEILREHLREGGVGKNIPELHGSSESTGYGLLDNTSSEPEVVSSKAQMKSIREQCKEILLKPDSEITKADKKILAQYEGGGGLKEQDATSYETLNAFYTPRNLIKAVWQLADHYAPHAKTVLEPTAGIGRFAENRPDKQFTLREYDETSSRIARLLHPQAQVIQGAFQSQFFDENGIFYNKDYVLPKYDLVIGNPPYGAYTGEWKGKGEGKDFDRYEEYFIARGLDSLKDENSILAFVVPSGFLNTASDRQKELIASKGRLVDAYRLPAGTFPTTEVGTDIIIMQQYESAKDFNISYLENKDLLSNGNWFKQHPKKILGEVKIRTNRFGKEEEYVAVHEGLTVQDELDKIGRMIPDIEPTAELEPVIENNPVEINITEPSSEEKPFIMQSFERLDEVLNDNPLFNVVLIEEAISAAQGHHLADIKLNNISDRDYRQMKDGGTPWSFKRIVDIESKCGILVCRSSSNSIEVVASVDKEGELHLNYDRLGEDYKNLTAAKRNNLDSCVMAFKQEVNDFAEKFIGVHEDYFYFRDVGAYDQVLNRHTSVVDTKNNQVIEYDHNKRKYSAVSYMDNDRFILDYLKGNKGYGQGEPFFASFDSLYSDSGVNFAQVLEDEAYIKMSAEDNIQQAVKDIYRPDTSKDGAEWEEELRKSSESENGITDIPVNECLGLSHITTKEEYVAKIEGYYKNLHEKQKKNVEEKHNVLLTEQEWNPKFDVILNSNFDTVKEISLTSRNSEIAVCQKDKNNPGQINVFINEAPAFAIDETRHVVTAFNNCPVTKYFLEKMRERWDGDLSCTASDIKPDVISLEKLLAAKKISKAQEAFAEELKTYILDKNGYIQENGKTVKNKNIEGTYVSIAKNGTILKVYLDGNKYTAAEYDFKTDYLYINQDCYDRGIVVALQNSFRNTMSLTIVTDIVMDNQRYVDTDGLTVLAPPKPARYNPEKEEILDNEQFAKKYGKNWNPEERVFWEVTDYKGYVDTTKLTEEQKALLLKNENYITEQNGRIIHKELFASGNIYNKLLQNENLWNNGKLDDANYERNKKILEEAKPKLIPLQMISVSVISPFVESYEIHGVPLKDKFLQWATGCNIEDSYNSIDNITDFSIAAISRDDIPSTIKWSDIKSYVYNEELEKIRGADDDDEKAQIRNQKKNDRKETAEKLFTRYLQTALTKEEADAFVDKYNRTFNHEKAPDYAKLPLFIDGMNQYHKDRTFKLYEQQIKGISFLCNKGNGLLAYDVGLGKTAAGIVATVNQIQSGRSLRPLIIVPKSVIGKWETDIHELFPDIPVNNLGNFSKEQVGSYYDGNHGLNIPQGSITLITKDALNNICFGKEDIDKYLFQDYVDLFAKNDDIKSDNPNVRASAREWIYAKAGIAEQVKSLYYIQWNKTGFDHLTVDEAHNFKNLFKVPRPKKGESSEFSAMGTGEPSKRALKMFNMTQLVQQQNQNRNVFMLTATPFTNSPLEVYSMLSYIARKELEQNGIKDLHDFCKQYSMTRFEKAVTKGGKDIQYKTVMKSFNDLPGLQNILKQYIDKVDGEEQEQQSIDFRNSFVRPIKETHTVFLDTTDIQENIFNFAVKVMDYVPNEKDIERRQSQGKKGFAPVLEAMNLMRTACLSPALVDKDKLNELLLMVDKKGEFTASLMDMPSIKDVVECSPKLKLVCDTVISNWKVHKDCGQVIYMPEGTESYPYVIDYMVNKGIPKEVFAVIDGSNCKIGGKNVTAKMIGEYSDSAEEEDIADDKRAFVAECFNDKKNPCKILIGSSAIGEGMDLNGNSIAIYNCMLGWNPTEDVQVEGRIWRQGNEQGRVHIVYPLVYDSIDSLLYQKHSEKKSRITALFDYKDASTLNVEDINPEELKYELIKDPYVRAKLEISDKAVELKKQIVLLDNQLQDYDQLIKSRMRYTEKLADRENDKANYISNYEKSVAMGAARRTPEEQKEGLERFDKSISDCKKQIENVRRKFAEMEVYTSDDEHNFAVRILEKKKLLQSDMDSLYDSAYQNKVVEKYKKLLSNERISRIEKELTEPLDKTIQGQMKPMHLVEYEKKFNKYQKFLEQAKEENNTHMIETLNSNWKEYEDYYHEKYDVKEPVPEQIVQPVVKTVVIEHKPQPDNSLIRIIQHEIEVIEYQKSQSEGLGDLFDGIQESPDEVSINRKLTEQTASETINVANFAGKLQAVLKDVEINKENVLKAVNKLVNKMDIEEKSNFARITTQLNINNAKKVDVFFVKMAKGEINFAPNKKPPVTQMSCTDEDVSMSG